MITKGDIVEIEITDISERAQGIGKFEGFVIFVKGALPGQRVKVKLEKVKSNYALATLTEVVSKSDFQIPAICPHSECGGCTYKELSYKAELELKRRQVMEKLHRLAGLRTDTAFEILGMKKPLNYRNKAQFQIGIVAPKKSGQKFLRAEPIVGFYRQSSHDIINCERCVLQKKVALQIAKVVQNFIKFENLSVYNDLSKKGLFKNLIVKVAENTGEVMVILVTTASSVPNVEKLIQMLDETVENAPNENADTPFYLESVILSISDKHSTANIGKVNKVIAGKPAISEKLGDLRFEISASAFYQVNPSQTLKLYEKVLEFANLKPTDNILDLYCGVGTIGLFCAKNIAKQAELEGLSASECGKVIGVESEKSAVIDANRNAAINGITNAYFICGKAESTLENILSGYTDKYGFEMPPFSPDLLILDPPRSGCDSALLGTIYKLAPKKLIYVSCEVATLARDLKFLFNAGYSLQKGCIVDMFPRTSKTEVIVGLETLSKNYKPLAKS